jgi:PAS domain S-box-containing protein
MDSPIHVLHVDDEPGFAELATTYLERESDRITTSTALDAAAARKQIEAHPPDCVVSDYDMPGDDGLDLLEDVRELNDRLPFILYTGKGSETIASEAISAGVTDYLQKQGGERSEYAVLANRVENAVEQYRAYEALEANQERLSLFIDQSPLGVIEYNDEFEIVRVNERAEAIFGYEETELQGETWEMLVTDDSYADVDELTDQLADASGGFHSVDENVRKDGERIIVEWFNRVITDDDGTAVAVFSLCRDVTAERAQQREREEARSRLQALYENSPDMINIHDTEGTISDPNPRLCDQLGYEPAELTGMNVWEVDATLTASEARELWANIDAGERRQLRSEFVCKDGSTVPVEVHIRRVPIHGEDRFIISARDISDQVAHEAALERTNSVLSTLLESLPVGILVEDSSRKVIVANQRFTDLFDLTDSPDDLLDRDCAALATRAADSFVDPEGFRERIQELLAAQEPVDDTRLRLTDGRVFAQSYQPVTLPDGMGHIWLYRDVTEQAEHERTLERQNDRLDDFTSVVSHDLRTPLTVADGRIELAQAEVSSPHLEMARDAIDRSQRLITELLTLARHGEETGEREPVALASVIEECWQAADTAEADLSVTVDRPVVADPTRLRQLVQNLVENALTHAGTDVTLRVGELPTGFYVADDGTGFSVDPAQLFEPGYSSAPDGTGFGLAIVKRIAEAHGWTVTATASDAGGARFEFTDVEFAPAADDSDA